MVIIDGEIRHRLAFAVNQSGNYFSVLRRGYVLAGNVIVVPFGEFPLCLAGHRCYSAQKRQEDGGAPDQAETRRTNVSCGEEFVVHGMKWWDGAMSHGGLVARKITATSGWRNPAFKEVEDSRVNVKALAG